jgi:hypothetical protein
LNPESNFEIVSTERSSGESVSVIFGVFVINRRSSTVSVNERRRPALGDVYT